MCKISEIKRRIFRGSRNQIRNMSGVSIMKSQNFLEPPPMTRFLSTSLYNELVLVVCLSCYLLTLKSRYLCHQVSRTTCCDRDMLRPAQLYAVLTCAITTPSQATHSSSRISYSHVS